MASIITEVCRIENIIPHDNANLLEIVQIKGWQCVVKKGEFKIKDLVVYFQPDTILPQRITDRLGVSSYCSIKFQGMRIKSVKLRGQVSMGLVIPIEDPTWTEGTDVSKYYNSEKYIPPVVLNNADAVAENNLFPRYTKIENLRNYPRVIGGGGEEVVISEKIHGMSCRVGCLNGGEEVAGTRMVQRQRPDDAFMASNMAWCPWTIPGVRDMLRQLGTQYKVVILYGEVYGTIQKGFPYDAPNQLGFRAFDLFLDGKYVDYDIFKNTCDMFKVPVVPILYRGPYSFDKVKEFSEGKSTIGSHMREGVVCRLVKERFIRNIGRCIFKYLSDSYLISKYHQENDTTDI
jgi:RNA ligase (TIGR02306 family)